MEKVEDLINEIHGTISQVTSSRKDEIRVMKAMMNDTSYEVDVYDSTGKIGTFNPSKTMRDIASSMISGTTKISKQEADVLADNYEFTKNEAEGMVDISKEFIHTYVHTGRKMPLGGREKSNASLIKKVVPAGTLKYPVRVGKDKNGKSICEAKEVHVESYDAVKSYSPCPAWIKKKNK